MNSLSGFTSAALYVQNRAALPVSTERKRVGESDENLTKRVAMEGSEENFFPSLSEESLTQPLSPNPSQSPRFTRVPLRSPPLLSYRLTTLTPASPLPILSRSVREKSSQEPSLFDSLPNEVQLTIMLKIHDITTLFALRGVDSLRKALVEDVIVHKLNTQQFSLRDKAISSLGCLDKLIIPLVVRSSLDKSFLVKCTRIESLALTITTENELSSIRNLTNLRDLTLTSLMTLPSFQMLSGLVALRSLILNIGNSLDLGLMNGMLKSSIALSNLSFSERSYKFFKTDFLYLSNSLKITQLFLDLPTLFEFPHAATLVSMEICGVSTCRPLPAELISNPFASLTHLKLTRCKLTNELENFIASCASLQKLSLFLCSDLSSGFVEGLQQIAPSLTVEIG